MIPLRFLHLVPRIRASLFLSVDFSASAGGFRSKFSWESRRARFAAVMIARSPTFGSPPMASPTFHRRCAPSMSEFVPRRSTVTGTRAQPGSRIAAESGLARRRTNRHSASVKAFLARHVLGSRLKKGVPRRMGTARPESRYRFTLSPSFSASVFPSSRLGTLPAAAPPSYPLRIIPSRRPLKFKPRYSSVPSSRTSLALPVTESSALLLRLDPAACLPPCAARVEITRAVLSAGLRLIHSAGVWFWEIVLCSFLLCYIVSYSFL